MDNPNQQQIDALIQFIEDAEDPATVTNVIVATVLAYLADKVKTMSTTSDLENEVTVRQTADTALDGRITALQTSLNTLMSGNVTDAIESFNEVINFLAEVTDDETLTGLLNQINNRLTNVEDGLYEKADLDRFTSRLSYDQAPTVVLQSMGELDNVDNDSDHGQSYQPSAGATYWDENSRKIIYVDNSGTPRDMGYPIAGLVYCNSKTNLTYRWKGTSGWQQVGGGGSAEAINIANNLNSTSPGDALDAYQGKKLKDQVDYVYGKLKAVYTALGNIAFWDGKTAIATMLPDLDWDLPKHTVTLALTLSNAAVKVNGDSKSNGATIQVEEYGTLNLVIEPSSGCQFGGAPTVSAGNNSITPTPNQDGSYSVALTMGQSDVTLSISATATAIPQTYGISYGNMTHCSVVTSPAPSSIVGGTGSVEIEFSADSGYQLDSTCFNVQHADKSWNASTNKLTITNATDNVTIAAEATLPIVKFLKGYYLTTAGGQISNAPKYQAADPNGVALAPLAAVSEYIQVPAPEDQTLSIISALCNWGRNCGVAGEAGNIYSPSDIVYHQFFIKVNGTFKFIPGSAQRLKPSNTQGSAHNIATSFKENEGTEDEVTYNVLDAYLNGNLYVRVTFFRSSVESTVLASNAFIKVNDDYPLRGSATNAYGLVDPQNWSLADDLPLTDSNNGNNSE